MFSAALASGTLSCYSTHHTCMSVWTAETQNLRQWPASHRLGAIGHKTSFLIGSRLITYVYIYIFFFNVPGNGLFDSPWKNLFILVRLLILSCYYVKQCSTIVLVNTNVNYIPWSPFGNAFLQQSLQSSSQAFLKFFNFSGAFKLPVKTAQQHCSKHL